MSPWTSSCGDGRRSRPDEVISDRSSLRAGREDQVSARNAAPVGPVAMPPYSASTRYSGIEVHDPGLSRTSISPISAPHRRPTTDRSFLKTRVASRRATDNHLMQDQVHRQEAEGPYGVSSRLSTIIAKKKRRTRSSSWSTRSRTPRPGKRSPGCSSEGSPSRGRGRFARPAAEHGDPQHRAAPSRPRQEHQADPTVPRRRDRLAAKGT